MLVSSQKDDTSLTTDGSGDGSVAITHSFGYSPAFVAWRKCTVGWDFIDPGNTYTNAFLPVGQVNFWGDLVNASGTRLDVHNALHAYSDSSNLNIQALGANNSQQYDFRYYLLVDRAEEFTGNFGGELVNNYGFKISPDGVNVLTAKEYQLGYSSKYKALQHYEVLFKTGSLTLPAVWSSYYDQTEQEGTYIDFQHGLDYQPFFLGFYQVDGEDEIRQFPIYSVDDLDNINYQVSAWCDSTRVRVSFWRSVYYNPITGSQSLAAQTINIKLYIFTENLNG